MSVLYLLEGDVPWWVALRRASRGGAEAHAAYAAVLRACVDVGAEDAYVAVADALVHGASSAWDRAGMADGVRRALVHDVGTLREATRAVSRTGDHDRVTLQALAPPAAPPLDDVASSLRGEATDDAVVAEVCRVRLERGGGPLGRHRAFRWDGERLAGVRRPDPVDPGGLHGLDAQLAKLTANTEAFLRGAPAMHALLYGPRGSGKSTVVRGLLNRFAPAGLRLVALPAHALRDLGTVVQQLQDRPERFLVFVDDLSFDAGDDRYHPLKSLLEGGIEAQPDNVRLIATSNRRHLVQERQRDRPDPLDDDVHGWDTHHERLALADRFGLLVTFPDADRRRYLDIVRHLAALDGVDAGDLEGRADRFARHGNGYSGRTARQFVDAVRAGLA